MPCAVDAAQILADYDVGTVQIFQESDEMAENGSGWQFDELVELTVIMDRTGPYAVRPTSSFRGG
jgi:hypothetical protein